MSEPKQEFLRWGVLVDWLADDYGIPLSQTRKLVEEKIIKGAPLPGRGTEEVGQKSSATGKKNGRVKAKGRLKGYVPNYYRKSQVKEALSL